MSKQILAVCTSVVIILLVGCAGLSGVRNVGESKPIGLSRTSICAINQGLTGKEIYITGIVIAMSSGEFLLECQEMKGHSIWIDTTSGGIKSPTTTGNIVGVYGVVTTSNANNEPRLSAKGIEYLGKAQREEESKSNPVRRAPSGGSCH